MTSWLTLLQKGQKLFTVNKDYVEVIWFSSKETYHWVSVPFDNASMTVKDILDILPWPSKLDDYVIGIWGKQVTLEHIINSGDRIEIYLPLKLTPNEIRLRRQNLS